MKIIYCTDKPYNRTLYIDDNIRARSIDINSSVNLNIDGIVEVTCPNFKIYNDFFVGGTAEFNGYVYLPETTSYRNFTLKYHLRMNSFLFG